MWGMMEKRTGAVIKCKYRTQEEGQIAFLLNAVTHRSIIHRMLNKTNACKPVIRHSLIKKVSR